MTRPQLQAKKRTLTGRKIKRLRKQGILPANVFGKNTKSQAIELDLKAFQTTFKDVGETSLVDLTIDKKAIPTLVTNVQLNPVTSDPIHVDFRQVDLTQKVTANIPLEITGESPAVKEKGGVLVTTLNEIEIEALPTDLPDKFTADISSLKEIGDSLTIADLKVDSKLEIKLDQDAPIALIQEPRAEEEPEPTPAAEGEEGEASADGEGETEKKKGEQAKEGDSKETKPEDKDQKSDDKKEASKPDEKGGGDDKK